MFIEEGQQMARDIIEGLKKRCSIYRDRLEVLK